MSKTSGQLKFDKYGFVELSHQCISPDGVTQEHIANMLGHQRNRITLAARELLQEGLIEYGGGSMKILDRAGLEAVACECYRIPLA